MNILNPTETLGAASRLPSTIARAGDAALRMVSVERQRTWLLSQAWQTEAARRAQQTRIDQLIQAGETAVATVAQALATESSHEIVIDLTTPQPSERSAIDTPAAIRELVSSGSVAQ